MIGMILGNRYEIVKEIGSGGMANVYLARCRMLNRYVAVKILKNEFANDKEFLARFNKEAQAAAAINSPNIVNVYDVGHDGDTHYIVMEYVEGETLKEYIDKNGMLSWEQTVEFAIQICNALDKAHKNGIVHRDIKPQNIILTNDDVLKVTDFGIARASSNETLNMGESTMGSVHYFSPEQARGGYTDEKSDLYSLGVVMYELITGKLPFNGESPISIAIKHIQEKPVSPKEYNIAIPLVVESIILKAMSKEQNMRYRSAEEMLSDLYSARKHPEDVPHHQDLGDTIKITPVEEEPPVVHVTEEVKQDNIEYRRTTHTKKKTSKNTDKGSTKKAVVMAIISAFAILAIIVAAGVAMLGGCSRDIKVPDLKGKLYEDVVAEYEDIVITIEQEVEDENHEPGYILSQSPRANTTTKNLKEIKVKVVKSSTGFIMNNFENKTVEELKTALKKEISLYNIKFDEVEEESAEVENGKITRTYPPAGNRIEKNTTITIYISKSGVKVPGLLGVKLSTAVELLEKEGLSLGNVTPTNADDTFVVISQSKEPETVTEEGTKIDLTLVASQSSKVITVVLPRENDTTNVRVVQDGKVIHHQAHSKNEGTVDITVTGSGTSKIDIYFNGNYNNTVTVDL